RDSGEGMKWSISSLRPLRAPAWACRVPPLCSRGEGQQLPGICSSSSLHLLRDRTLGRVFCNGVPTLRRVRVSHALPERFLVPSTYSLVLDKQETKPQPISAVA